MQPSQTNSSMSRRVLVTGGTGTLGEAMVAAFANAGYQTSFQYNKSDGAAKHLESEYGATGFQMDFFKEHELPVRDFDILINNTGINESEENTHLVDPSVWARMFHINLTIPFLLSRALLPGMIERGWGRIINIGSIYSIRAATNRAPYVASKHGLSGLTKTIAREYAASGITCNEICPSAVVSNMIKRIAEDRAVRQGTTTAEILDQYRVLSPAMRLGRADEVASTALFLASEASGFINGTSVLVDGGLVT